jgi:hypothetical protein
MTQPSDSVSSGRRPPSPPVPRPPLGPPASGVVPPPPSAVAAIVTPSLGAASNLTTAPAAETGARSVEEPNDAAATPDAERRQAAEVTASAAAVEAAATAATAPSGLPPRHVPGPPGQPVGPHPKPAWKVRRHRRLPRLRIGSHVAAPEDLDRLQLTSASFGLLIGRDQAGYPVALPLFQPVPTRVALIGGAWATRLLAFRALAFGARVVVFTPEPEGWLELGRRAAARNDRISIRHHGDPLSVQGTADAPLLLLSILGPGVEGALTPGPLPAWTTAVTALPELTSAQVPHVQQAGLVLTQRLAPAEADLLSGACRVPAETGYALQVLHDDMVAVLSPGRTRYAWVNLSPLESHTLGSPGRV